MKLKHKLILIFVTISVLAVILVSFTGYNYIVNNSKKEINIYLQEKADEVAANMDNWLTNRATVLSSLCSTLENISTVKTNRDYLQVFKNYKDISDIYIGFTDGNFISGQGWIPPKGYDPRVRPWYLEALHNAKLNFSEPYLDMTTNEYAISVGIPLKDHNGNFIGIIGEDLLLSRIINIVKNVNLNGLGYGILVDKQGIALYHPNVKLINTNLFNNKELKNIVKTMLAQKNGEINYKLDNSKRMVYRKLPSTGWILGIVINTDIAYKSLYNLKKQYIIINIVLFICLVLVTLIFSRRITKSIFELIKGTEEIASGNLDKRLKSDSTDEIGELGRKFNKMAENLKNMIRERDDIMKVLSASEEALLQERNKLEIKVEERTQEYSALNEELSAMYEDAYMANKELVNEVTERKSTENRLEQKNQELEAAYEQLKRIKLQVIQQEKMASIGQLAAGVAHEINSPLGYVTSNIETLQKYTNKVFEYLSKQEETIKEFADHNDDTEIKYQGLEKIIELKKKLKIDFIKDDSDDIFKATLDGTSRIRNIVQELRGFSRVSIDTDMANINEGIESVLHIIWNEIKYKIILKKDFGDIPLTRCNIGQLNQVFLNLLVNASHAIEEKGEIIIKTMADEGYIIIIISDTGSGISPDVISRIFDPFFTTKEIGKGTGLGLSISYEIIKAHNGSIDVESFIGKGTTFTVKIPIISE